MKTTQTTAATQRARIAAYTRAALHDGKEMTAKARSTFMASFLARIPEDLPEDVRLKRAEALKKAHFTRLAYKSAKARKR